MFSTLKYVNASNFEKFREQWKAEYLGGFVVHNKAFDNLKGNFPIGFLIWNLQRTKSIESIYTTALDKNEIAVGEKVYSAITSEEFLNNWITRPRSNKQDALPLKNALNPATSTYDVRGNRWADGAIGGFLCSNNDLQHSSTLTAILSSGFCSPGGMLITQSILWQAAIVFAVRRLGSKPNQALELGQLS